MRYWRIDADRIGGARFIAIVPGNTKGDPPWGQILRAMDEELGLEYVTFALRHAIPGRSTEGLRMSVNVKKQTIRINGTTYRLRNAKTLAELDA